MADDSDRFPIMSADDSTFDAFLSSMTFANSGGIGCECDECGPGYPDMVPQTIRNAVNEHKKRKLEQEQHQSVFDGSKRLHIRQERELVKREGGFSMWRFDLPAGGDPIVEYQNSHRILFIKKLSKVRICIIIADNSSILFSSKYCLCILLTY
jgi:hypothetical protein